MGGKQPRGQLLLRFHEVTRGFEARDDGDAEIHLGTGEAKEAGAEAGRVRKQKWIDRWN